MRGNITQHQSVVSASHNGVSRISSASPPCFQQRRRDRSHGWRHGEYSNAAIGRKRRMKRQKKRSRESLPTGASESSQSPRLSCSFHTSPAISQAQYVARHTHGRWADFCACRLHARIGVLTPVNHSVSPTFYLSAQRRSGHHRVPPFHRKRTVDSQTEEAMLRGVRTCRSCCK